MRFADLMALPFDGRTERILANAVREALPATPEDVIEQVYVDHGRKEDFQKLYGHLALDEITWKLQSLIATELSLVSYSPNYRTWFDGVRRRVDRFPKEQWSCIDVRPAIREHWALYRTWLRPPVLIHGHHVRSLAALHLVEGHTRLALLEGLTVAGIISFKSTHQVWIGH